MGVNALQLTLPLQGAYGATLDELLEYTTLSRIFHECFANSQGRGIDKTDAVSFGRRLAEELPGIRSRCLTGRYRFAPYLEVLRTRGAKRPPRAISIPTVRDRLVLRVLKERLHHALWDRVHRTLPNAHIRALKHDLATSSAEDVQVIRRDIKDFYDSIDHDILESILTARGIDQETVTLVKTAVKTPTVPAAARRPAGGWGRRNRGVPQGLSVSNILANAYAMRFDQRVQGSVLSYHRYVDDILILVERSRSGGVEELIDTTLVELKLTPNPSKSSSGPLVNGFGYLGYEFRSGTVTVRDQTVDRFLGSIASRITRYVRGRSAFLKQHPWVDEAVHRQVFLEDLNERITGAVRGPKRYGWLFYFSEIEDAALLYRMDRIIKRLLARHRQLRSIQRPALKRLVRAWNEIRRNPNTSYVFDYGTLQSTQDKLDFLARRGRLNPSGAPASGAEVDRLFEQEVRRRLAALEADVGSTS